MKNLKAIIALATLLSLSPSTATPLPEKPFVPENIKIDMPDLPFFLKIFNPTGSRIIVEYNYFGQNISATYIVKNKEGDYFNADLKDFVYKK